MSYSLIILSRKNALPSGLGECEKEMKGKEIILSSHKVCFLMFFYPIKKKNYHLVYNLNILFGNINGIPL